jgi:hypothetical protein
MATEVERLAVPCPPGADAQAEEAEGEERSLLALATEVGLLQNLNRPRPQFGGAPSQRRLPKEQPSPANQGNVEVSQLPLF